jgi:hypothetical protein
MRTSRGRERWPIKALNQHGLESHGHGAKVDGLFMIPKIFVVGY